MPGPEARMIAGFNAGPSRVVVWNDSRGADPLTTEQFISRIDIPSTRAYVSSILDRYQKLKAQKPAVRKTDGAAGQSPSVDANDRN